MTQSQQHQKYCAQNVPSISVLSLNIGVYEAGGQEKMRSLLIEEFLMRSDADFLCLQNVPHGMYLQWLQSQSLMNYYGFTFNKRWFYDTANIDRGCTVVLTKWPSYSYEVQL